LIVSFISSGNCKIFKGKKAYVGNMEVIDAIRTRRSVRKFKKKAVPMEIIKEIIELGNSAPSAGNLQARDFIVVSEQKIKEQLAKAALGQFFLADAPVVLVVCSNLKRIAPYGSRGKNLYCIQDASAAIQNILLTVHSKGLSSCWIGAFSEKDAANVLSLPDYIRPIAIIPIGYADEKADESPHIPIEKLIHHERW
jgi:nitroreductase